MEPICVPAAKPFQSPLASAPALRYSKTEPPATAMRSALPSPLTSATASAVTPVPGATVAPEGASLGSVAGVKSPLPSPR